MEAWKSLAEDLTGGRREFEPAAEPNQERFSEAQGRRGSQPMIGPYTRPCGPADKAWAKG